MKKQLVGVALSALMFAAAAEARSAFGGGSVGVVAGHDWSTLKLKGATSGKESVKPSGVKAGVTVAYSDMVGSVLVGGDVRALAGFGSDKKSVALNATTARVEVKNDWTLGLGLVLGGEINSDWLAFVRLGVDYNHYKTDTTTLIAGKKFNSWAFVPGLGVKTKIAKDWSVDASYEYSHGFQSKNPSSTVKFDKKPTSHGLKLGVSYYL